MSDDIRKIVVYLSDKYSTSPKLSDIFHSFERCSRDEANGRSLVQSEEKCINFDRLTKWLYKLETPQSADSLTFSKKYVYLIEFKAGNQVANTGKRERLIRGVLGKINDSERTIFNGICSNVEDLEINDVKLRFYLVVDVKEMGISALTLELAKLSVGAMAVRDPNIQILMNEVLPDLKDGVQIPKHFDQVDIWYSELFEEYLRAHKIISADSFIDKMSTSKAINS